MKRNGLNAVLFFAAMLFFVSSCGRNANDNDQANNGESTTMENQPTTTTDENVFWTSNHDYAYEQKDEFREDVNSALDRLDDRIDELQTKAMNTSGDTKEWYNDRISDLKDQRTKIQNEMNDFVNITEEKWNDFKSGLTSAWNDIEDSWNSIANDDRLSEDKNY